MIKILHSADWHLDAPLTGHSPQAAELLRRELRKIPERIAKLCIAEQCDMMLLSGDLFDGTYSPDTLQNVQQALSSVAVPVFIAPGNHDYVRPESPYAQAGWPDNVHIFLDANLSQISLPELDCRIYGAGYEAMDCPALLKGFHAAGPEKHHLGILHAEVEASGSAYCPISRDQLRNCGLSYLALGHIHKSGSLRAGDTLCAWPGCPMGHGYDELGAKGVIILTIEDQVSASFLPLDTPRFYDEEVEVTDQPQDALRTLLPALYTDDFYRVTLTGYSTGLDLPALQAQFPHIPNLLLRDETRPEMDMWSTVGEDTLEGVYFGLLRQAADTDNETLSQRAKLAARLSRQILDGQEVKLP